jgi:hypothetical protein
VQVQTSGALLWPALLEKMKFWHVDPLSVHGKTGDEMVLCATFASVVTL